jgi:hypothetical protein
VSDAITQNGKELTLEEIMQSLMTNFGQQLGTVLRQVVVEEINKLSPPSV